MKDDYSEGYSTGFIDGIDFIISKINPNQISPITDPEPATYLSYNGCDVCGIGINGDPLGYVCQHPDCPYKSRS
ncbi:hypothetical protein UFOVP49_115 [uncultured Caudovirales phage]|uniref:Uncharacterized protein n=1 Tax=uncultured Caudovirales phage TaxID=2100421 RepID=A0A6J5KTQ0_9CAUD|nr:hypothetical protein UFOVP49_115 [uncultured Caudovirales phage]